MGRYGHYAWLNRAERIEIAKAFKKLMYRAQDAGVEGVTVNNPELMLESMEKLYDAHQLVLLACQRRVHRA